MKNFMKYIYIIGIFGLMSFWSQNVSAAGCITDPNEYHRTLNGNDSCVPKLCIGHSDGYCLAIGDGNDPALVIAAKEKECMGAFYAKGSYKQRGDADFCKCVAQGGTELAVAIPFVGGSANPDGSINKSDRCVPKSASGSALPLLIGVIIQILNTLLLVGGFAMFVWAGVLYTMQDVKQAKKIMRGVFGAFALYGSLGLLLRLINPTLFT